MSLGASWSLDTQGPGCSQGKPEGDKVISGLGLCEPGPSWRQWGAGLVPDFWKDPPWVRPHGGVLEGRGGSKAGPANEEAPSS